MLKLSRISDTYESLGLTCLKYRLKHEMNKEAEGRTLVVQYMRTN
jgi:hypothetical protein